MTQPQDPGPAGPAQPARTDRSPWNWLLLLPIVLPLITVIYNRESPHLFGWPFFFWFQVMFTLLAAAVTTIVFLATRSGS
jgi:dolichyl-phosphate-mannose--protein O-mannosyl transferase